MVPKVDNATCIGCGLCVARCPVGAAYLDKNTAAPLFGNSLSEGQETDIDAFKIARDSAAATIVWEAAPFTDSHHVAIQLKRFQDTLTAVNGGAAFRLLIRNTFLLTNDVARLKSEGDNHAWAEIAVSIGKLAGPVEVEYGGDTLDAFRRVLTGASIAIGRYGHPQEDLIPIVAMVALPNGRVDYYRVVKDASRYLNLRVRTAPLVFFLLSIRDRRSTLQRLREGMYVDQDETSCEEYIKEQFGLPAASKYGLTPIK